MWLKGGSSLLQQLQSDRSALDAIVALQHCSSQPQSPQRGEERDQGNLMESWRLRHSGVIISLHHPGLLSIVTTVHHVIRAGTLQAVDNLSLVGQLFQLELLIHPEVSANIGKILTAHWWVLGCSIFRMLLLILDI